MNEIKTKPRSLLDRELTVLRDNVLRLAHMADSAIERSIQALKEQNVELGRQVIADDQAINTLRYQIESDCYRLLSLQQPTARDLRSIVTAIHIVVELERIGDHAQHVAEHAIALAQEPMLKPLIDLPRMAHVARDMMRASLDAYLDWNAEQAEQITQRDREIDNLDEQIYRELLTFMLQDPRNISRATHLLWAAHDVERIGDRIKNICERIGFMVTGQVKGEENDE